MLDEDVITSLRARVRESEPPITNSTDRVKALGRTRIRRRRVNGTFASAVVVVGAIGLGLGAGGLAGDGVNADPAARTADSFSPERLVSSIRDQVKGVTAGAGMSWTEESIDAQASSGELLEGADRSKATRWKANFSAGDGTHFLEVTLTQGWDYEGVPLGQAMETDCAHALDAGFADTCVVSRTEQGGLVQSTQRAAARLPGSWPVVTQGSRSGEWYLHQVVARNEDGLNVAVTEVVKAASLSEAEAAWTVTSAQLEHIAIDEALWFPNNG